MNKVTIEDLELAISRFIEDNNLDNLTPFAGHCKGLAPYGELDLGNAINSSDWETVRKLIAEKSDVNFSSDIKPNLKLSGYVKRFDKVFGSNQGGRLLLKTLAYIYKYYTDEKLKNKPVPMPEMLKKALSQQEWDHLVGWYGNLMHGTFNDIIKAA